MPQFCEEAPPAFFLNFEHVAKLSYQLLLEPELQGKEAPRILAFHLIYSYELLTCRNCCVAKFLVNSRLL